MWLGVKSRERQLALYGGRAPGGSSLSSQSDTKSQANLLLFFFSVFKSTALLRRWEAPRMVGHSAKNRLEEHKGSRCLSP